MPKRHKVLIYIFMTTLVFAYLNLLTEKDNIDSIIFILLIIGFNFLPTGSKHD